MYTRIKLGIPENKRIRAICLKRSRVELDGGVESLHITNTNGCQTQSDTKEKIQRSLTLRELKVWSEGLAQVEDAECGTVWDLAQQHLHDGLQLLYLLVEAVRRGRGLADSLRAC